MALLCAALITFGLFYFMQALISSGEMMEQRISVIRIVDATMPEIELDVIEEIDRPEPIEELMEQQPDTPDRDLVLGDGPGLNMARVGVEIDTGLQIGISKISAQDGDYLPLVRIPPQYPSRALQRGIEGWCLVEFTVNAQGGVDEDSIVVVDSEPLGVFNSSASRAALRFKFQPRVVDGVGVAVPNVPYLFSYKLDDS